MIAAERGYDVTLCLPRNASAERKEILRAYGVEIIETSSSEGTDGAQIIARQLAEQFPDRYVYLDQYNNEANWRAHYETTGKEIWEQTKWHCYSFYNWTRNYWHVHRRDSKTPRMQREHSSRRCSA